MSAAPASARSSGQVTRIARVVVVGLSCANIAFAPFPRAAPALGHDGHRINIVEAESEWPVPLVELRTTGNLRFVSDNAGVIAIEAPELFGRETWFFVSSDGYEVSPDGFGYRGVRVDVEPGGSTRLVVNRTSIARRLGRVTGAGQFGESQRLGLHMDWIESGVVGCDSVQNAVHRDRLFWIWGDTALFDYPLGIFHASAATTPIRPIDRFEPPLRIEYELARDPAGRPRGVAEMPGPGPTWLTGLVSLPDAAGQPRLVAFYSKIRQPMNVYEWGLCEWSDERQSFDRVAVIWREPVNQAGEPESGDRQAAMDPAVPEGHAVRWTDDSGESWVLFGNPFPAVRCRAAYEAWRDVATYERLTPQPDVVAGGAPNDDGPRATVTPHSGSIAWHPWRARWVAIFTQKWGAPSAFGEVWYAEADSPLGPWGPAVKALSHANYTFYNPRLHAEWFEPDSPTLVFEGTHSQSFANRPEPTPRHDYNQVLYRLDLDDPALNPARDEHECGPALRGGPGPGAGGGKWPGGGPGPGAGGGGVSCGDSSTADLRPPT